MEYVKYVKNVKVNIRKNGEKIIQKKLKNITKNIIKIIKKK